MNRGLNLAFLLLGPLNTSVWPWRSWRGGLVPSCGPRREAPGSARTQREWREMRARAFTVVSTGRKGWGRGLGLASVNNFRRLWGTGTILVVWYLALGWLEQEASGLGVSEPKQGGGWGAGSGYIGLHGKAPVACYFQEFANSGRGSPSRISKAPDVRTSE